MDEYDVFLDEICRNETLLALQEFALQPVNLCRQLFIITPNTLSNVTTTQQVRIQRLKAPKRTHSRGPQQQFIATSVTEQE